MQSSSIKTVVFDLGKVLVDFDYSIAVRKLAARAHMKIEDFAQLITHAPLLLDYESGKVTTMEFYSQICTITGFCGSVDEFAMLFGDIFTPIDAMIGVQHRLKAAGYPTYILSNTNELAVRHIRSMFPFFNGFDGYVLSYEVRSMKPEPAIYEALERKCGFHGPEILYLDDRAENIDAAAARKWQTILHQDVAESKARMQKLGVLGE